MYASDLTNKKRAQAVYSDVSRQKALFDQGAIFRINYQKGGTDYAYMMELEQGCINNKCFSIPEIVATVGNATSRMNIVGAIYMDVIALALQEYGYAIFIDANGNSIALDPANNLYRVTSPSGIILQSGIAGTQIGSINIPSIPYSYVSSDDVYFPLPLGSTSFYFFGNEYNSSTNPMYWSTNNAIIFNDPGVRVASIQSNNSMYTNGADLSNGAILLGNYDRRLDKLYVREDSIPGKYSILTLFVFYEDFNDFLSTPNTGEYQIRLIRELTGLKRQWVEVRVVVAPVISGYIAGDLTRDTNPVPPYTQLTADPTKLSPYNITDGTRFLNLCGSTFSRVGPAAGTSFVFQSDSTGSFWVFQNNNFVPV